MHLAGVLLIGRKGLPAVDQGQDGVRQGSYCSHLHIINLLKQNKRQHYGLACCKIFLAFPTSLCPPYFVFGWMIRITCPVRSSNRQSSKLEATLMSNLH